MLPDTEPEPFFVSHPTLVWHICKSTHPSGCSNFYKRANRRHTKQKIRQTPIFHPGKIKKSTIVENFYFLLISC